MDTDSSCQAPDTAEISRRLTAVQSAMVQGGLDYYLCFDPDNVCYLTNFFNYVHERPFILLVPAKGTPTFLMPKLEEPHVKSRAVGALELLHYFEFPAPVGARWSDRLLDLLEPRHKIGVETRCPLFISQVLPSEPTVVDIVDDIRILKSDFEIGRIRYASELFSRAHETLISGARPGDPILQRASAASGQINKTLLQDNPDTNLLASTTYVSIQPPQCSHDPHNVTGMFDPIAIGGPHVTIVAGRANGYGAEVERTFFVKEIPEAAKKPFDDMISARELAFSLCVPGMSMWDVDRQVNELMRSRGWGEYLLHRTGHSFGVSNHEGPFLAEGYDHEIQPRMIFSIEPGIYVPGVGGFRFSDTILVTDNGNRTLTRAPTSLGDLILPGE